MRRPEPWPDVMEFAATVPQFLREGDVVNASVRLSNTEKKERPNVKLAMESSGGLKAAERTDVMTVGKNMEQLWPLAPAFVVASCPNFRTDPSP